VNHVAAAEREIAAPAATIFAYLADLEQHWNLADEFIQVVSLERPAGGGPAHGGVVRMCGPLRIWRAAHTRVVEADPPTRLSGSAEVGDGTSARVTWSLSPAGPATRVRLEASVEHASRSDRILLALGGRRWLTRRFAGILQTLERRVGQSVPA
jgi:uncharacterized protein YndB with AHSA1/START domain